MLSTIAPRTVSDRLRKPPRGMAMRTLCLLLGILSMAAGLGLVIFTLWAGEASLHLGSPLRLYGDLSHLIEAEGPRQRAVSLYRAGLRVIDVLETSLGVHLASAALFVALGLCLLLMVRVLRPQASRPRSTG